MEWGYRRGRWLEARGWDRREDNRRREGEARGPYSASVGRYVSCKQAPAASFSTEICTCSELLMFLL
jgi:hypothetical protein